MFAILFGLMFFSVVGCGDSTVTGSSAGDASASFKINWHNSPAQSDNLSALNLDCAAEGIATVLCEIYDADGTWLASGGPWPCSTGAGKITRIPPGPRRTFVIFGLDENNQIVYQGQSAEIDLEPGDNNDAGTIEAFSFRPVQTEPADNAQLPPGPVSLTWQPVSNASAYRVFVATSSDFMSEAVIIDAVTGQTVYTLDEYRSGTDYYWQIRAIDVYGNESAPSDPLRRFRTQTLVDLEPPTVAFTDPSGQVNTASNTITVYGTASDNVGVTQVSWANDRGGSGICTGTTAWSASGILLYSGTNVVTVTASDAAGNTGSDTLTVIYTIPDLEPPTVAFTDPSGQVNTTSNTITVYGTASDNVGVTRVSWANDRGGSGNFTGTTTWSGTIPIFEGTNVITATARDTAGNTATDTLTVIYTIAWRQTFPGRGQAHSVQLAPDGGYIVAGESMEGRAFLLKIDGSGAEPQFWEYLPPVPQDPNGIEYESSVAYAVQVTADGGYILAGEARGVEGYPRHAYVVKTHFDGEVHWQQVYDYHSDSRAFDIQITDDGYIVVGSSCPEGCVGYMLKIEADGKFEWERLIWGDYGAEFNAVQVVSDGYIVAGSTYSHLGGDRVYLVKTDPYGEELEEWQFGGSEAKGKDVWIAPDGGYIIAGTISTVGNGSDAYVIKTRSNGVFEWEIAFGGPNDDAANAVRPFDGGYVIAGTTTSDDETVHMYLAKISIDEDGELVLWEKSFVEEEAGSYANSMQVTPDNGFIIAGYGDPYDVLLLKTDADGNLE